MVYYLIYIIPSWVSGFIDQNIRHQWSLINAKHHQSVKPWNSTRFNMISRSDNYPSIYLSSDTHTGNRELSSVNSGSWYTHFECVIIEFLGSFCSDIYAMPIFGLFVPWTTAAYTQQNSQVTSSPPFVWPSTFPSATRRIFLRFFLSFFSFFDLFRMLRRQRKTAAYDLHLMNHLISSVLQ